MKKNGLLILTMIIACMMGCATNKAKTEQDEQKVKNASINIQLGMTYLERKDPQRAKGKLLRALDQAPHLPEAWYAMGYFLEKTGDAKKAGDYYLKAVELDPARGDVQNNYGTYLCRHSHYRESIEHFEKATKDNTYLDSASAYENAGLCALKIPDKVLAADFFRRALAQDPDRKLSMTELVRLTR